MTAGTGLDLRAAVREAARAAGRLGRPQWAALCAELPPRDWLAAFDRARDVERFYWERPDQRRSIAALGAAAAIETAGRRRFAEATRRARELFKEITIAGEGAPTAAGPLLVGGFAFARSASDSPHWREFPPGRLVLPEVLIARWGERSWCTITRAVPPGADAGLECGALRARLEEIRRGVFGGPGPHTPAPNPGGRRRAGPDAPEYRAAADRPHADYRARVARALEQIAAGELEKVVVARSVRLTHRGGFDPGALLGGLRRAHPSCASFAIARPGCVFLGATPEHLVQLAGRRVGVAALAGSAPRGRSPEEDARLGRALRESKKEQAEHAIVVRALCSALRPRCDDLEVPEAPRLRRLEGIQHLETPLAGTLRDGASVLDVLGRLHPTPSVAGAPREPALDWLAREEDLDRGWYGGPIGFVDRDGGGEFCIALRSALLRGEEARLFAGAGIVAGSTPDSELRETRLKLSAMLASLLEI